MNFTFSLNNPSHPFFSCFQKIQIINMNSDDEGDDANFGA